MIQNTEVLQRRYDFCQRMIYWVAFGNLGYDQSERDNLFYGGETDCSKLVIDVLKSLDFNTGIATYTGNMRDELVKYGWVEYPVEIELEEGDILLNHVNHVAVYVGDGHIAEAALDEFGGIVGGQTGDQTDNETRIAPYRNYPWDCVLRYEGSDQEKRRSLNMIIVIRIEDNQGYLVEGGSIVEIDHEEYKILSHIGVEHVRLYNGSIYKLMDVIHRLADDEHATARAYQAIREMAANNGNTN